MEEILEVLKRNPKDRELSVCLRFRNTFEEFEIKSVDTKIAESIDLVVHEDRDLGFNFLTRLELRLSESFGDG